MSEPTTQIFHGRTTGNRIATYFAATRPAFLTASLFPVLAALAMVWGENGELDFFLAFLTLLNIALIHSAANVLNDYFDARNGSDENNTQRVFPFTGGSRFIQNGVLTLNQVFRLGVGLMVAGIILGLVMVVLQGPLILGIGLLGVMMAVFYSAPPCLACKGLGDIVIATCFGILPVIGTVYIQSGEILPTALWLGLIIGCYVAAILWINSIPDIEADRMSGKLTLPVRLGEKLAAYGLPLWFIAGTVLIVLAPLPAGSYLALLAIVPAAIASKALLDGKVMPAIPLTLATHASVCILLTVGFLAMLGS